MNDSKYNFLSRLKPLTQALVAIALIVLSVGVTISWIKYGTVNFNKEANTIGTIENKLKSAQREFNIAAKDSRLSPEEIKKVADRLNNAVESIQEVKLKESKLTDIEKYGVEEIGLKWVKTPLGRMAQIYVLFMDFHLTHVPFECPVNFQERWMDVINLICNAAEKSGKLDKKTKKNYEFIDDLNDENIKMYKDGNSN